MAYSTNWQLTDSQVGLQGITEVSTTQQHALGTVRRAVDRGTNANGEGTFIYVKGVTNGAAGSWVIITTTRQRSLARMPLERWASSCLPWMRPQSTAGPRCKERP